MLLVLAGILGMTSIDDQHGLKTTLISSHALFRIMLGIRFITKLRS